MNKEEIKHFKAMLRQGLLRHRDILLNEEFQKELLNIIKDYEKLQQENKQLRENNQAMQEEMARTWKKLEVIKKLKSWLSERLDDENDIFSVVRVRDVLFRLNKLENKGEENEKDI